MQLIKLFLSPSLVMIVMGLFTTSLQADHQSAHSILERISKVGSVCIAGVECDTEPAVVEVVERAPRAAETVYNTYCSGCHNTGAAGAPIITDREEWQERMSVGLDNLVASAIKGVGAMPARGACADCTDEEIYKTVEYMLGQSI